jgi:hypothetical protein
MTVERGFQGEMCRGDATASMTTMDVLSESLRANYTWIDGNGIKGTRARNIARTAAGEIPAGGNITIHPVAGDLTYFLPKITGDTSPSSGLHKLQETLPDFFVMKKESQLATNRVYTYTGVQVGRATFACSRGQPLTLSMDCLALSETTASTYPSTTALEVADPFWMFHQLVVSLAGTTYEVFDWSLTIDHQLAARPVNSRNTTQIYCTDRIVTVQMTIPYGDVTLSAASSRLSGPFADVAGFAHVATFTSGSDVLVFTCPKIRHAHLTPVMQRGEIAYQITGQCYQSGVTALTDQEVDITLTDA